MKFIQYTFETITRKTLCYPHQTLLNFKVTVKRLVGVQINNHVPKSRIIDCPLHMIKIIKIRTKVKEGKNESNIGT